MVGSRKAHRKHARSVRWGKRRGAVVLGVALLAFVGVAVMAVAEDPTTGDGDAPDRSSQQTMFRAFDADSWWNAPLPEDTPLNPHSTEILEYMRTAPESGSGCLLFAGAGGSKWGHPIYWADPSDSTYDVAGVSGDRPPELSRLRIPDNAQPAANSDGSMSVYDVQKGYVVALTDADYDASADLWTASGATVTYLDSNGLYAKTGRSDDPRNRGTHRGNNGATMAVAWDEARAGAIRHVLKVAAGPEVADRPVFPMVGSDGDYRGDDPAVPPQGLRFRIKPSVDLERFDLKEDALVIAQALQRYGFYIGDSGGTTALKLQNTIAEGRGQLWNVPADALCNLPFTREYWDVVAEGYDPSR